LSRVGNHSGYREFEYNVFKNWRSWVAAKPLYQAVTVPVTIAYGEHDWSKLRERNVLLIATGFAPAFSERSLEDPALHAARKAIDSVLTGHEPYPALAIDHHWTLITSNKAVPPLLAGVDSSLLSPPVNVLRLSLHPLGLAPRIANYAEWRSHLLARLRRQIDVTADPALAELMSELSSYPTPSGDRSSTAATDREYVRVVVPFQLVTETLSPGVYQHYNDIWNASRHHLIGACPGILLSR
jgi:hypothetical protein